MCLTVRRESTFRPISVKVGFLFQNYALWPNMTVYQNISFGLSNIKEELPKYDFDAMTTGELIRALKSGKEAQRAGGRVPR